MKTPQLQFPRIAPLIAALLLAGAAAPSHADPDPPLAPSQPDAAEAASQYLGNIYKDDQAGVRLAPPRGCAISKSAGSDDIVSFKNDQKMWVGDLLAVNLKDPTNVENYLRDSVSQLSQDFKGVQVLETRELTFQKHKAGRLTITMDADISAPGPNGQKHKQFITLFRQQLMIQMSDKQFLILQFYTPIKDQKIAEDTFTAMLANFELVDKEHAEKVRFEAIKRGKDWLAKLSADDFKSKLINQPQWYRMKAPAKDVGLKDVGFMQFQEAAVPAKNNSKISVGHAGILLQVNFQDWPDDASAVMGQNLAFWAFSHDDPAAPDAPAYSAWDNATKTFVKRKNLPHGQYLFWIDEAGILFEQDNTRLDAATLADLKTQREALLKQKDFAGVQIPAPIEGPQKQFHLTISFTGDPTQAFQNNGQPIDLLIPDYQPAPAVLPKILEYVWPRLVDLSKPSLMVFAVYNAASHKMDFRSLSVIGPEETSVNGKLVKTTKCRDEIGNAGTTLWVDSSGHILKMLTSDQSLIEPTTEAEMTKLWRPALDQLNLDLHSTTQSADNPLSRPPSLP